MGAAEGFPLDSDCQEIKVSPTVTIFFHSSFNDIKDKTDDVNSTFFMSDMAPQSYRQPKHVKLMHMHLAP